jgi:hypothetical protein
VSEVVLAARKRKYRSAEYLKRKLKRREAKAAVAAGGGATTYRGTTYLPQCTEWEAVT